MHNIAWPPRSPDLTRMDFFLQGHIKGKVYGKITKAWQTSITQASVSNLEKRLKMMIERAGAHASHRAINYY